MIDPLTLGFDTSGAYVTAALLRGDRLIAQAHEDMARGQVERLMPLIESVLAQQDQTWADLDVIGVGVGPGNFTGVRIAVSAARGLALGLGADVRGVSGFEALYCGHPGPALCCVPAPRGQFYIQPLGFGTPHAPQLCAPGEVPAHPARAEPAVIAYEEGPIGPTQQPKFGMAEAVARVALARRHTAAQAPKPLYIKAPDAAPARNAPPVLLP